MAARTGHSDTHAARTVTPPASRTPATAATHPATEARTTALAGRVPGLADARRAAKVLIDAGVGRVLAFGSVARGEAHKHSDIDLVAIYDDLGDYSDRIQRRSRLEELAGQAAGHSADVMVTDAPEWAVRTAKVPCSLEARIVIDAVELAAAAHHARIDWYKEIGLPDSPTAELQQRFTDMADAVAALTVWLQPGRQESAAAQQVDSDRLAVQEDRRWARAMGEVHMVFECAAKATHIAAVGTAAPHDHRIDKLVAPQPPEVRDAFEHAADEHGIDLAGLHVWRSAAAYSADRPDVRFDETALRAHAAAALLIADAAAEHCRRQGLPEPTLRLFDNDIAEARAAVAQPLRHPHS